MVGLVTSILEFLAVLVAAFKGISAGDKWVGELKNVIKENTRIVRELNRKLDEQKTKDTDD